MKQWLVIVTLILAVSACKDDDNLPRAIFTLTLTDDAYLYYRPAYVIIRDHETSEFLDTDSIAPDKTVTFETDKRIGDNKVDVIYYTNLQYDNNRYHDVNVYMGVDVGAEWTWSGPLNYSGQRPTIGTYGVHINDLEVVNTGPVISDRYGFIKTYNPAIDPYTQVSINDGEDKQLITINNGSAPSQYHWLEGAEDGDQTDIEFSDMKTFTKYAQMNVPHPVDVRGHVVGYRDLPVSSNVYEFNQNTPGYILMNSAYPADEAYKMWLLDELPYYNIYLVVDGFSYVSLGPPPTSIEYVDPSEFMITNKTGLEFAFTTSRDYLHRAVYYEHTSSDNDIYENIQVTYHAAIGDNKPHYQPLTDDLMQRFDIPIDMIEFSSSEFFIEGPSYNDFIKSSTIGRFNIFHNPTLPFIQRSVSGHW